MIVRAREETRIGRSTGREYGVLLVTALLRKIALKSAKSRGNHAIAATPA